MYRQQKESVYHLYRKVDIFSVKSTKVTLAENQLFSGKSSKAFRGIPLFTTENIGPSLQMVSAQSQRE